MSYKLKLGVALAAAALALPTFAAAQDPTARPEVIVIGAVLADESEHAVDHARTDTPAMPIVYEDDASADTAANAEASTASAGANLGHGVEPE